MEGKRNEEFGVGCPEAGSLDVFWSFLMESKGRDRNDLKRLKKRLPVSSEEVGFFTLSRTLHKFHKLFVRQPDGCPKSG